MAGPFDDIATPLPGPAPTPAPAPAPPSPGFDDIAKPLTLPRGTPYLPGVTVGTPEPEPTFKTIQRPLGEPGEVAQDYAQELARVSPQASRTAYNASPVTDFSDPRYQAAFNALKGGKARVPRGSDTDWDPASPESVADYLQNGVGIPTKLPSANYTPSIGETLAANYAAGGMAALGQTVRPAMGVAAGAADAVGADDLGSKLRAKAKDLEDTADAVDAASKQAGISTTAGKAIGGGIGGAAPMLAGPAAIPLMGAQAGGNSYLDAKNDGADTGDALLRAGTNAAITGLVGKYTGAATRMNPGTGGIIDRALVGGAEQSAMSGGMAAGDALSTAITDPEQAKAKLAGIPAAVGDPSNLIIGGVLGGGGAAARALAVRQRAGAIADAAAARPAPFDDIAQPLPPIPQTASPENIQAQAKATIADQAKAQAVQEGQDKAVQPLRTVQDEEAQSQPDAPAAPQRPTGPNETRAKLETIASLAGLKGTFHPEADGTFTYLPEGATLPPPRAAEPPAPELPPHLAAEAEEQGVTPISEPAKPVQPAEEPPAPVATPKAAEPAPEPPAARPAAPSAPPRMTADDLRAQVDALPVSKQNPGQTDAFMSLVEARARSAGMPLDDYVGRTFAGVEDHSGVGTGSPSLNQPAELHQGAPDGWRGVAKQIPDAQRDTIRNATAAHLVNLLGRIPAEGIARPEHAKMATQAILDAFGHQDAPRFTSLLAAVGTRHAAETWKRWNDAGRPADVKGVLPKGVTSEQAINASRALTSERPPAMSGRTTDATHRTLQQHLRDATDDTWAGHFARVDQGMFGGKLRADRGDLQQSLQRAADTLSQRTGTHWNAGEVRDHVWQWAKALENPDAAKSDISAAHPDRGSDGQRAPEPGADPAQHAEPKGSDGLSDDDKRALQRASARRSQLGQASSEQGAPGSRDGRQAAQGAPPVGRLAVPEGRGGARFESLTNLWRRALGDHTPVGGTKAWMDLQDKANGPRELRQRDLAEGKAPAPVRGSVRFLQDGRAIIKAFQHADVSTLFHELGHVFRRDLSGQDLATVEKWAGVKNGKWGRPAEEKFARSWEQYLRNGQAPTPELKSVFHQFYEWMHQVYTTLRGSPLDHQIPANVKAVFDRLLTEGPQAMHVPDRGIQRESAEHTAGPGEIPSDIDHTHSVPYGGGHSAQPGPDGRETVYVDKNIGPFEAKRLDGSSGTIDPTPYIAKHEAFEEARMREGATYDDAHVLATQHEHEALRADGWDPKSYEAGLKPMLDEAGHRRDRDIPADLNRKPYTDSAEASKLQGKGMDGPSDATRLGTPNRRPDLATPGTDPEGRKAYVEARNASPDIESRSRADIRAKAKAAIEKDPEGVFKKLLSKTIRGDALNAHEMAQAPMLLERLRQDPDRAADYQRLNSAYQLAGNEGAVAMGMRADQLQTPEGRRQEALSIFDLPRAADSRRIEKLRADLKVQKNTVDTLDQRDPEAQKARNRIVKLEKAIADVEAQVQKRAVGDKKHMKSLGFDLDHPEPDWAADPDRFAQFIGAMEATKGGLPAVAREMYVGLKHLSGTVFGKKILADAISIPYRTLVRHIEALVGEAKRAAGKGSDSEASVGELAHMWHAVGPAMRRAGGNALDSLLSGEHPTELSNKEDNYHYPTLWRVGNTAIHGASKVWQHATLISTVRAIDAFTRSFVAHVEVAGRAYRSGVDADGKRLKDQDLADHMRSQVEDFGSEAWGQAREAAMHATFVEKPMEIVRRLNRMKYQQANTPTSKALKATANALFPFTTIPSNIARQGVTDWTPGLSDAITIAKALKRDPETGEWQYNGSQFNEDVAKAAVRWASLGAFGALANGGYLTGSDDKRNPLSFNLGDHHLSYRFLGPIARGLGAAADWFAPHAKPMDGMTGARVSRVLEGAGDQFSEVPVVRLAADLWHAAKVHDGGTKWLADQAVGIAEPSIAHQAMGAAQDEVRAKQYAGKNAPWLDRFATYLEDRATSNSGKPVKIDGRPLVKDRFDSDIGTYAWRLFSPLTLGTKEPEPKAPK